MRFGNVQDNAEQFIIAFDFDGTITSKNNYPKCKTLRPYVRRVINLLHDMGVKVVIWTCRENIGEGIRPYECMVNFLNNNCIKYDSINSTIEFAPWSYESKKIYAHMYVDDMGFGWDNDDDEIMLKVLRSFLNKFFDMTSLADLIVNQIRMGVKIDVDTINTIYNDGYR